MVSVRIAVRVMLGFGLESRSDETFFFGFFLFSWKYSDFLMFDARKEVLYGRYIGLFITLVTLIFSTLI